MKKKNPRGQGVLPYDFEDFLLECRYNRRNGPVFRILKLFSVNPEKSFHFVLRL